MTISRPQPIAIATRINQPRTKGVSGCGRSVCLIGAAVGSGGLGEVVIIGSVGEVC